MAKAQLEPERIRKQAESVSKVRLGPAAEKGMTSTSADMRGLVGRVTSKVLRKRGSVSKQT